MDVRAHCIHENMEKLFVSVMDIRKCANLIRRPVTAPVLYNKQDMQLLYDYFLRAKCRQNATFWMPAVKIKCI